jgi:hypothetical protein
MLEITRCARVLPALMAVAFVTGCGDGSSDILPPDEIPHTVAEFRFDEQTGSASAGTASWLSPSSPTLLTGAGPEVSCDRRSGDTQADEVRLTVFLPATSSAGDVIDLEDTDSDDGGTVSVSVAGNISYRIRRGWVVVDERNDEQVSLRIDAASSDGTKSVRGAVVAPFCP